RILETAVAAVQAVACDEHEDLEGPAEPDADERLRFHASFWRAIASASTRGRSSAIVTSSDSGKPGRGCAGEYIPAWNPNHQHVVGPSIGKRTPLHGVAAATSSIRAGWCWLKLSRYHFPWKGWPTGTPTNPQSTPVSARTIISGYNV